jgi:hypothetical protein
MFVPAGAGGAAAAGPIGLAIGEMLRPPANDGMAAGLGMAGEPKPPPSDVLPGRLIPPPISDPGITGERGMDMAAAISGLSPKPLPSGLAGMFVPPVIIEVPMPGRMGVGAGGR